MRAIMAMRSAFTNTRVAEGELRGAVGRTERGHELHGGEDDERRRR